MAAADGPAVAFVLVVGRPGRYTWRRMKARTYIETSIPSFYFEARQQPEMLARRSWMRAWWTTASETLQLVTSLAVVDELKRGEFTARDDCLTLIENLPLLAVDSTVLEVVQAYIHH